MALSLQQKSRFIESSKNEYGDLYERISFPDETTLLKADKQRQYLLECLADKVSTGCLGTKLDIANLSPGCRICIEGHWSCLFINGICNGSCFYCPTSQNEIGLPTTNTLTFSDPGDYAAYLQIFGFQGASISGGEPLLTPDKSASFIQSIKKRLGDKVHVWLYTNGILATRDLMKELVDAGLDEIRFDIGATGYSLRQLDHAVGVVPTVTVEIPAIPEDCEQVKKLLPALHDCGVHHLNLHQLRLTLYNFEKLVSRGYRFLNGPKVTVLDSELCALDILLHGKIHPIDLPINYCSFPYKNRFQAQAARRRNGEQILKGYESLTENGFIRTLMLTGKHEILSQYTSTFERNGYADKLWKLNSSEELFIHCDLLPHVDLNTLSVMVSYSAAYQRPSVSYRNPFSQVSISRGMSMVIERETSPHRFRLSQEQLSSFLPASAIPDSHQPPRGLAEVDLPEEIIDFEFIRAGLAEYF